MVRDRANERKRNSDRKGMVLGRRRYLTLAGTVAAAGVTGASAVSANQDDGVHEIAFVADPDAASQSYEFAGSGVIEFADLGESPHGGSIEGGTWSTYDAIDQGDGEWTATGGTGNGHGDGYRLTGSVTDVELDDGLTIYLDGEEVTPDELVERTAADDSQDDGVEDGGELREVAFVADADAASQFYEFAGTGTVEFADLGESPHGGSIEGGTWSTYDAIDHGTEEWIATGGTGNGHGDGYYLRGSVTDVELDDGLTIYLDGEEVTPDELVERTAADDSRDEEGQDGTEDGTENEDGSENEDGEGDEGDGGDDVEELPHRLVIDGGVSEDTAGYTFGVSGEVRKDPSFEPMDDADAIDGSTVAGEVTGEADGYRFSGSLTDLELEGSASIEIDRNAN